MTGRFNYNFTAQVSRLNYNGGNKGEYEEAASYDGYFGPVDQDSNIIGIQTMGQAFQFQTEAEADIIAGDKMTIDGQDYIVRGVIKHDFKRHYFKAAILELPENNDES